MEFKIQKVKTRALFIMYLLTIATRGLFGIEAFGSINDLRNVEKHLLSMLGMKIRPVINRKELEVPKEIIDLYEKQVNLEYVTSSLDLPGRHTESANTVRYYFHEASSVDDRFPHDHRFRLNFNLTSFPSTDKLNSAELNITIVPKYKNFSTQRVSIYDILKPGIKGKSKPILRLIETRLVEPALNGTARISLFVLSIVQRWLSDKTNNHGLLIDVRLLSGEKVKSSHARLRRSIEYEKNWLDTQPVLYLYSTDSRIQKLEYKLNFVDLKRKRKTRSPMKMRKHQKGECRRHELWVDFEKVGWNDWIVAPSGYHAFYCAGDCPLQLGDHLNTTNHAIVQSLMHTVHPHTIPKPCCVPTSLSSIAMLYTDENYKTVLKNYPDMQVEGCGCL